MKRSFVIYLILMLFALIAVLTNPNQERHKEVIKSKLNVYLQKSIKGKMNQVDNQWEQAGQALGMMLGSALINRIVDNLISTNNYVFFSTTKITWEGKSKIIGIGAFGNVYVTNKLDEALKDGALNNQ